MHATVAAVVLGILLLASSDATANTRGSGYGSGSTHFARHYRSPPTNRTFRI